MNAQTTLDRRHQVFVSSTYLDLVEERRAIIQALLELDCIPAGMEMFPAASEDQWTLIREVIDLSDYYIVVVGGRYGSVTSDGVSFTEMEYDYAVAKGIPVLGFVHSDPGSIPVNMSEIDATARVRLDAFRAKVMQRMVKEYRTAEELASVVSRGLVRAMKRNPRPGWVRGDQAMTDAVRAEVAELRAALAQAEQRRTELAARDGGNEINESFEHGSDEVELEFVVSHGTYTRESQAVELEFTWDEIVDALGPSMIDEAAEPALRATFCSYAWKYLLEIPDSNWDGAAAPRMTITNDSWGRILVQLRALGIITTGSKKRTVSDKAVYWTLTPAGDEYLVRLKATKRPETA
ncbi:DUF4062 domain-containing protein [Angustibacter sp. Root456]|uniref:DUF4062 domain-containing protein n=1 Tax=Angustibacter sp. Root456 TaxID=1736539 RepID=UPI00138F6DB7|nr:DUF4062 domain-containing protein [Angustibacter sp. Root456]